MFDFLKSKNINVKSTGKMDGSSKIQLGDDIDHNLAKVKADAVSSDESGSMSSDDEDFNPDELEAKSAKEEYDSDPSDTGSDTDENFSGSEGEKERKRAEKAERRAKKEERKKTSKPTTEKSRGGGKKKKKTKLPGQPKKPMSAYFMWVSEEGREKLKKENPGISVTEVGKKTGEIWRSMAEDEKKKWEKKAAEAKEKYDVEYKEWLEGGGAEALKEAKKEAKKESKKGSPKKSSGGGSTKSKSAPTGGSGGGFKSKEFIEDSSSDAEEKKSSDKSEAEADSGSD